MIKIMKRESSEVLASNLEFLTGTRCPGNYQNFIRNNCLDRPIFDDQHGKCYICERRLCTDTQIDHLIPVNKDKRLAAAWRNLFISCSYCNLIKGDKFDGILNPLKDRIARDVEQRTDFENDRFVFRASDEKNERQRMTARLLSRIFNEDYRSYSLKKWNFHRYAMREMRNFKGACERYLELRDDDSRRAVAKELTEDSEFLGLKYWMLRDDEALSEAFADFLERTE